MRTLGLRGLLVTAVMALLATLIAPSATAITNPDLTPVSAEEAPWMVSIWRVSANFDRKSDGYLCGGVLIDQYTVLTAAHCITATADSAFVVVAGQRTSTSRGQVGQPRTVTLYPQYRAGYFDFDIAVIDLYAPMVVASYPRVGTNPEVKYLLRKPTILYGWGENQRQKLPTTLRRVVQYDQSIQAKKWFPDFSLRTQFAVGRLNRDGSFSGACNRDAGSPLIGKTGDRQILMGLSSYGSLRTCTTKSPRVFTRVSWYAPWITRIQTANSADRASAGVDYTNAFFAGSETLPLPTGSGVWSDERTYISGRASFGIETALPGTSDLQSIEVFALAPTEVGEDFVVDLHTRTPWSGDVCQWRDLAATGTAPKLKLGMLIPDSKPARTGYLLSFTANAIDCFGESGNAMTVSGLNATVAPTSCVPKVSMRPEGFLRVVMQQSCFPNLTRAMVRVQLVTAEAHEVEPGLDAWAGPFNLMHPSRA